MCGIIAYIGKQPAVPILVRGLRRLEYRGYDSAGVAVLENNQINRVRAVGKIDMLAEKIKTSNFGSEQAVVGIAHTRWATHGGVTEINAHPHTALNGKLAIVHNGIIENYRELKAELIAQGIVFASETDTEVLAQVIARQYRGDLRAAVEAGLKQVRGTYGVVAMHADHPEQLVAARMGSPLVIGIGENEHYIASDATPILAYTKKVVFLSDGEVADVTRTTFSVFNLRDEKQETHVEEIDWDESQAEKQGFAHFMLKEIFDQPQVLQDAIRGRYDVENGTAHLGGLNMTEEEMRQVNRVIFLACGTASYAGLVGKYAFERLAGIAAEVEVSSEFRYRDPVIDEHTLVFVISQSGETADTLAAAREAKRRGAFVRGIVNAVGSTIARETDGGTYIHAGPELAVASTKAYTNMSAVLILYALQFGRQRRVSLATGQRLLRALEEIPTKIKMVLDQTDTIKAAAERFVQYKNCFFIGRGINFPIALEGAIKLKEISYIHAEAYAGGELKHGPIALLSGEFPVVAIMTKDQLYDKMRSNVEEVRARKAPVVLIATEGDEQARELAEDIIFVPETMELLQPLVTVTALQLLAYHAAVALKRDVDRPRNLAKSVTVE